MRSAFSSAVAAAVSATLLVGEASAQAGYKAGETQRTVMLASAAPRNKGDASLRVTIWYPASEAAKEEPVRSQAFAPGHTAANAAWADGPRRPLILLSHGFGGVAQQMTWLGAALARSGYVAVAVDHPGTNGRDGVTPEGVSAPWARVDDLKAALDLTLGDAEIGPRIDAARIGAAGFSLGGWTVALIAGARADFAKLDQFCVDNPQDGLCRPQIEAPFDLSRRRAVLESAAMSALAGREKADHRDQRIRAAFLIAPALGPALDRASLAATTTPVAVLVGADDRIAAPAANAAFIAGAIPGARLTTLPGVGHYDFLAECGQEGFRIFAATFCQDGEGTTRAATHATTIDAVRRFFDEALR